MQPAQLNGLWHGAELVGQLLFCSHRQVRLVWVLDVSYPKAMFSRAYMYCVPVLRTCTRMHNSKEAWRTMTSTSYIGLLWRERGSFWRNVIMADDDYCDNNLISLLWATAAAILNMKTTSTTSAPLYRHWVLQRNTERRIGSFVLNELMILDIGGSHSFLQSVSSATRTRWATDRKTGHSYPQKHTPARPAIR